MGKVIGPTFGDELGKANLLGLPFSWGADGSFSFMPTMTPEQIDGVMAVYEAHDPDNITYFRNQAKIEIDKQAENTRLLVVTPGSGQSLEYSYKVKDAELYLSTTPAPTSCEYFYLNAELGITGSTLEEVAQVILYMKNVWDQFGAAVAKERLTKKKLVDSAINKQEVDDILAGLTWPTPPQG